MGSGAIIYIPSFIKIDSGVHKLLVGGTHTDIQAHTDSKRDLISPLLFKKKGNWAEK
jgi:hypothetical protein